MPSTHLVLILCWMPSLFGGSCCGNAQVLQDFSRVDGPSCDRLSKGPGEVPPNLVFILTDDQDSTMGGLDAMTKAKELIGKRGVTFSNSFVASPLCCPSRSSILTGRYVHNHKAWNNSLSGGCASRGWQKGPEHKTFPVYLKQRGYTTFFAGKYLNQYGKKHTGGVGHIPPGWDDWHGLVGNSRYYDYSLSENGQEERHGDNYTQDYLTDVIGRKAVTFLEKHLDVAGHVSSTNDHAPSTSGHAPFLLMLSTPACHAPFTPAPQYAANFPHHTAPRSPSFGRHSKDKHWLVRAAKHPMSETSIKYIDKTFRNRWRTLLSVDDLVEKVVNLLTEKKVINDTYIIFTSDNGFHLGQFSLPNDKRQMYEFDIRVPLMIRGPGIAAGQVHQEPVVNVDIAPTLVELSGGAPPPTMDGQSLVQLLLPSCVRHYKHVPWRRALLIEHQGEHKSHVTGCPQYRNMNVSCCFPDCVCEDAANNTYVCLRYLNTHTNAIFCQFSDSEMFTEVYDLTSDPHQLVNINALLPASVRSQLVARLIQQQKCAGRTCADTTNIPHLRRHLHTAYRKAQKLL